MLKRETDPFRTFAQNVRDCLEPNGLVLHETPVALLEKHVKDLDSPWIFVSGEKIVFAYDSIFEVFNLSEISIEIVGDSPKFSLWQQLIEPTYKYGKEYAGNFYTLLADENITRIIITDGPLSRTFAIKKRDQIGKTYQTWALGQHILNSKNKVNTDNTLIEMMSGNFGTFNTKTVQAFIAVFVSFALLIILTTQGLPDIINTILTLVFGGIAIAMTIWLLKSMENNNRRFYKTYLGYKQTEEWKLPPT